MAGPWSLLSSLLMAALLGGAGAAWADSDEPASAADPAVPVPEATPQAGFQEPRPLSGGTAARELEWPKVVYPWRSRVRGEEGWVLLSFVIREDGTVADPVVEDSSGVADMERSALAAAAKARYSPATWNGKPVEQCAARMQLSFHIKGSGLGARAKFKRPYKEAAAALEAGQVEQARTLAEVLAKQEGVNHYEGARLSLLRAEIASQSGDPHGALHAYRRAVRQNGAFLEEKLYRPVMREIFRLEVELRQWANALTTYEKLRSHLPAQTDADLDRVAAQIRAAKDGPAPLGFEGIIGYRSGCEEGRPNWQHVLLRRKFAFDILDGKVEDFQLRCDWRLIKGQVNTEQVWEIPESWGWCQLFVFGEKGARVKLVEYPAPARAEPVATSSP